MRIRTRRNKDGYMDCDEISIKTKRLYANITFYPIRFWTRDFYWTKGMIVLPFMDVFYG